MKYLIVCLLLLTGCAKKITWPASVNFESLNNLEVEAITNSLKDLSTNSKKELFYFEDKSNSFKITVTKMANDNKHLGMASVTEETCLVQLNEIVFEESYSSYFVPVLYHEVGHCAGMMHDPTEGEIMYYIGSPIDFYTQDAFQRFFNQLVDFVNKH